MALVNDVIYAPGHLWIDPTDGAIDISDYPDNMTGTYLGETSEPLLLMYDPKKIGLVIDGYGDIVVDWREIGAEITVNVKLAQLSVSAKYLYWGKDRVTATGGVILPGPDASNIVLSAPAHKLLFVTKASIAGKTTEASYKMNWYMPRCQPKPAGEISFGNEYSDLDIDLVATYQESASAANKSKRLFQIDTVANITVF